VLGMPTGLFIRPFDAGYRLTGIAISWFAFLLTFDVSGH
jgi:hypothetical protein